MIIILNKLIRKASMIVSLMIISYTTLRGQAHDYLFHPSFFDQYLTMQALPGGDVRVFAVSDQTNGWPNPRVVYVDFSADGLQHDQQPVIISSPGQFVNNIVFDPLTLRCNDGSTIIANNFFDCDYWGSDAIYKLNMDGEVDWAVSFWDSIFILEVQQIAFVDSNTILVRSYEDSLYFNMKGQVVHPEIIGPVFNHSAQTSYGYLGGLGDSLIILDQNFEPLQIYLLEGDIVSMEDVQLNEFRIRTTDKYYVLNESLQLNSLPFSTEDYDGVWSSTKYYWGYQQDQDIVIRFDTFFNALDTFQMSPGVSPLAGIPLDHEVLILNAYDNEISDGVIAFQHDQELMDFKLPQDIGITDIALLDTILVELFPWSGENPGWVYHIPALTLTIENFGPDTVTSFFLQGFDLLECFWCLAKYPIWYIDSMPLPPGASGVVRLNPFVTHCGSELNPEICLTTIAPDKKADGNYLNDKFCRSFDFILETNEQVVDKEMLVYPNPASDKIYFDVDQPSLDNFICTIYDATGNAVDQFKEIKHGYSLQGYAPGIYLVMLTNQEGIVGYQRIVKANQ
jgi:hypothetical protein